MVYFPIIGAAIYALATIFEKNALKKRGINIKTFHVASFLASIIVMLPLIYFFWGVSPEAWQLKNILLFLAVIIISIFANLCLFFAIKWEKITNIEPALIMEPLFTVLLALIFSFFTVGLYERETRILIPALIAGAALIFSHVKKHHLSMNKYFLAAILGSFLFGLELVLSRLILDNYTPISFYFIRCLAIFLISYLIFRPNLVSIPSKMKWNILLIGGLWVAYRIIIYYGYLSLGVIFTTLLMTLGPVFIYLLAKIFLKEKLEWRNIIASIIIVACVVYVTLS